MAFHVLLQGRSVGPYDRRTIVGMRIKHALASEDVLIATDGSRLTVADLIGRKPAAPEFNPARSCGFSLVQAAFCAGMVPSSGHSAGVPKFKGEIEVRVQGDVLRLAGRFRRGFGWKEGRCKIPLKDIVHARIVASQVELWLSDGGPSGFNRITLEMFTAEAAAELLEWLPAATPPAEEPAANSPAPSPTGRASPHTLWIPLAAIVVVLLMLIVTLLSYRRA